MSVDVPQKATRERFASAIAVRRDRRRPNAQEGVVAAHEHDARQQVDRQTGMLVPLRVQRAGLALACAQQVGRIALRARSLWYNKYRWPKQHSPAPNCSRTPPAT